MTRKWSPSPACSTISGRRRASPVRYTWKSRTPIRHRRSSANKGFDDRRQSGMGNSTPSIGLREELEVALCTAGVRLDVVGTQHERIPR